MDPIIANGHGRCVVPASVEALAATATGLGEVSGVIHAAGVSPSQAAPATILAVDLYGAALVLKTFRGVIAPCG